MNRASAALMLGASAMFANMYSTQAILPELGGGLNVGPATAGLSISVVVAGVAAGAWLHGPLSDRVGRRRVMIWSAALLVVPTALLPFAPGLWALLGLRLAQGLLMPGLLVVAIPYITERFSGPRRGAVMGAYTSSLVLGGFVGRVGTAVVADLAGWRPALALLAVPTLLGAMAMRAWLPPDGPAPRSGQPLSATVRGHVGNLPLMLNAVCAGAAFFAFVGVFTFATYRLIAPPLGLSLAAAGLVYGVWLVGALVTPITRRAEMLGPERVLPALLGLLAAGAALTLIDHLAAIVVGLGAMALAMFTVVPACQLMIPRLALRDRGTATSLHLTIYYLAGGLGGYLPGLLLDAGWADLVAGCLAAVCLALASALGLAATLRR